MIIFCHCYLVYMCSDVYQLFEHYIDKSFMDPVGVPHCIARCRLVDMYCKCTDTDVKEAIVSAFTVQNGALHTIVIATLTFGMGLTAQMCSKLFTGVLHMILSRMFKRQEEGEGIDVYPVHYFFSQTLIAR